MELSVGMHTLDGAMGHRKAMDWLIVVWQINDVIDSFKWS